MDGSSLFTDQGGVIVSALEFSLAEHDNAAHITPHVIIFTSDLSSPPSRLARINIQTFQTLISRFYRNEPLMHRSLITEN